MIHLRKMSIGLLVFSISALLVIPSWAQDGHGGHGGTSDATAEATTEAPHDAEDTHDGDDHNEEINCESVALATEVTEHLATLENLATVLVENNTAGLEAIYTAGVALQTIAEACGYSAFVGDATNGEVLFNTMTQTGFACATCHLVTTSDRLIGPGLLGIGDPDHDPNSHAEGDTTVAVVPRPDLPVVDYIRQSIVEPNAYVVPTYPENLMPLIYAEIFSDEQINDIIAYLLTLEHSDH